MNIRDAYRILEVTDQDDEKKIKIQFRKKISQYHPDVAGMDSPANLKKAQMINEAYTLLRKRKNVSDQANTTEASEEKQEKYTAEVNEYAFVERDIYMPYYMDERQKNDFKQVARGRYFWDPDQEEFDLLLRSLNRATMDLMEKTERDMGVYREEDMSQKYRFQYQLRIFNCLANQFIQPVKCLKKLIEPEKTDQKNRDIYRFRARLGVRGSSEVFHAFAMLQQGDLLYPSSLKNNRITVSDQSGIELGHLSLDDDQLYYLIIPILQSHKAQVKFIVTDTKINMRTRPYQAKANVDLYLRLDHSAQEINMSDQNLKIAEIMNQYEAYLKEL